jgi:hypothetical protein
MKLKVIGVFALLCLALGALPIDASADGRTPGACLLFPYYNTNKGNLAVITITNSCKDDVVVRLVWIDEDYCSPEDQWIKLTGYDTFSFLDSAMNPEGERGFMYAYVVDEYGSKAEVATNCLIGQEYIFAQWIKPESGAIVDYGINALSFYATTVDGDGMLLLDGSEYDLAPKTLLFPRFFGQDKGFSSQMVLINLTGGKFFKATAEVLVYNDNEQAWSSTIEFPCFWIGALEKVSAAVTEEWLMNSFHNPLELWDGNGNPKADHKKTGWISITGDFAYSDFGGFKEKASLYGYLVEKIGGNYAADLPFEVTDPAYNMAALWSINPNGN